VSDRGSIVGEVVTGLISHLGNRAVLDRKTLALLCSIKCPGSVILRTYDLMRDLKWTDQELGVALGTELWHLDSWT